MALPLDGPPKDLTDAVLPDEFPLNVFYEALRKKLADVIASHLRDHGMSTASPVAGSVAGRVVVVAGAAGAAGPPLVARLAAAGATVVAADASAERLEPVVAQGNAAAAGGGNVHAAVVDLLDEQATTDWAAGVLAEFGRVDGLVHLVGGWRGGESITESDLADWALLQDLLIRTLQHTSRAFHDSLQGQRRRAAGAGLDGPGAGAVGRPTPPTPRPRPPPRPGPWRWPTRSQGAATAARGASC